MRPFIRFLPLWLSIALVVYLGMDALVAPKVSRAVVGPGSGIVTIARSYDQHFYVEGAINGHKVTFMVDTGATLTSVGEELAAGIGLERGVSAKFQTAAGSVLGRIVPSANVSVGGIDAGTLRIAILPGNKQALLGANFLNKVELITSDDRLILKTKASR